MTTEVVSHKPNTRESRIVQALLACGGDILLVKEKLNRGFGSENPVTEVQIVEAFLQEASTSTQVHDNIKALLLLNFLQILTECKQHLQSGMGEASYADLLRTIQMIITGIAQLFPQPNTNQNDTQVNILQQFGAGQAKERVIARLETYAKVDEKYGTDANTAESG